MEQKPEISEEFKAKFAPERVNKYLAGEISGKELFQLNDAQMLRMAMRGFQQYEQGRYPEAQAIFQGLVGVDSKEPYYRIALGAVFLAQDDLENAERSFNAAIGLNTTEVAAYVNRGEVYLRTGRIREAALDFKKAVDLDPKGKDPLTQRARLLARAALDMIRNAQAKEKGGAAPAAKGAAPAKGAPAKAAAPGKPAVAAGKPPAAPAKAVAAKKK